MPADEVLSLVQTLEDMRVTVWLDGGWAVDALLGEQTREHADLNIVVQQVDEPKVRHLLQAHGYEDVERPDTSSWNFVLGDFDSHQVDVHVIAFDSDGNGLYGPRERGVVYPAQSLTGRGSVNGREVRCISPEWLVKFHTGDELDENDYWDVYALHQRFAVPLPEEYRPPPSLRARWPLSGLSELIILVPRPIASWSGRIPLTILTASLQLGLGACCLLRDSSENRRAAPDLCERLHQCDGSGKWQSSTAGTSQLTPRDGRSAPTTFLQVGSFDRRCVTTERSSLQDRLSADHTRCAGASRPGLHGAHI